jgi:hypothetical protein
MKGVRSKCLISIDGIKLTASVIHVGRGKFKILDDGKAGKYVGRIIDASDILHCED